MNIYPNNVAPWNPSQPNINNKPINFIKIDQQSQFKPQPAPIYIPNNKPQPQVNPIAPNQQILPSNPLNQSINQPQIFINPPTNPSIYQQPKPIPQPQPNQQIFINPTTPSINQQQKPIVILPNQQVQPNPAPIQSPVQIIPQPKPAPQ